jgi:NADPH:quinone reductase-like Zn-dependent oxidoreductase
MIFGNFSLVGVLMTYVEDEQPLSVAEDVSGVNYPKVNFNMPPRSLGLQIHDQLLDLFAENKIKSVIGLEVGFEELPAAIDRFERREILGRVVVHVGR